MNQRPTINDIARLAHVSKKTVSRVINNSPFVHAETRARINAVIAERGFVPDPQARGLAFRQSSLVGFIYQRGCDIGDAQQTILDALRDRGLELVVRAIEANDSRTLGDIRSFIERRKPVGVILHGALLQDRKLIGELDVIGCRHVAEDGVLSLIESPQTPVRSLKNSITRRSV